MIEKDCHDQKIHACNKINSVVISMRLLGQFKTFIFLRKYFAGTKTTRRQKDTQAKAKNANKQISDFFPLRCF